MKILEDYLYRLSKELHGSRKVRKERHNHQDKFLKEIGFRCSNAHMTLYLLWSEKEFIFSIWYVDYILMSSTEQSIINMVIMKFKTNSKMITSKKIDIFYEFQLMTEDIWVKVHNTAMNERALEHFKIGWCRPILTLLPAGLHLSSKMRTYIRFDSISKIGRRAHAFG